MIYTGYFAKTEDYKKAGLTPIGIAGKAPDFYEGVELKKFAPSWDIYSAYKYGNLNEFGYVERYIKERLNILDKQEVKQQLLSYENPILLCYEKDGFCHRHILADWIEMNLGLVVKEYKID